MKKVEQTKSFKYFFFFSIFKFKYMVQTAVLKEIN